MVECKYNQVPYCLQDINRLRDRSFITGKETHVSKIPKRHDFLMESHDRICGLLGYLLNIKDNPKIIMLYITRQIYLMHRILPTEIEFIQVGKLDNWLIENKDR